MTNIKIALSTNTLLNFPFYLLESDPVSYGLNEFDIFLDNKDGDETALKALEDGYHFAVGDPAKLYNQVVDNGFITKCAIKPVIIKTALWGLTSKKKLAELGENNQLLEGMRDAKMDDYFNNIHTYHSGTTAYRSLEYLSKNKNFSNIKTTDIIEVNNLIGQELDIFEKKDEVELVVTSDILAVEMFRESNNVHKVIDFYNLDIDVFQKSVFTALITNINLLKTNDYLIEKMIKALDEVLITFNRSSEKELEEIAKKIYQYNERQSVFKHKDKLTVEHIKKSLMILQKDEVYPKKSTVKNLCRHWENTCVIWEKNDSNPKQRCKKSPNNFYNKLWQKQGWSKKIQKLADSYNTNWIPIILVGVILIINYAFDEIEEEDYYTKIVNKIEEKKEVDSLNERTYQEIFTKLNDINHRLEQLNKKNDDVLSGE